VGGGKIKIHNALFKDRFKDTSIEQGHVLTSQLNEAEKTTFEEALRRTT